MNSLIENYINGNLTKARKQARRFKLMAIIKALKERGHSLNKALLVANWMKTGEGWQAACDAE